MATFEEIKDLMIDLQDTINKMVNEDINKGYLSEDSMFDVRLLQYADGSGLIELVDLTSIFGTTTDYNIDLVDDTSLTIEKLKIEAYNNLSRVEIDYNHLRKKRQYK